MNVWRPACVGVRMSTQSDPHQDSIRRDAWRARLLQEQVVEEMAQRRRAISVRRAVMLGIAHGVLGSISIYVT